MASIFKKDKRKGFDVLHRVHRRTRATATGGRPPGSLRDRCRSPGSWRSRLLFVGRGVIDHESTRHVDPGRKSLADHLNEFHAHLIAKGNTAKHADLLRKIVRPPRRRSG